MSTLISSATSGKKAAPKAPPRRRPAGPPPPAKPAPKPTDETLENANNTTAEQQVSESAAPAPTPPPTQQPTEPHHVRFAQPETIPENTSQVAPTRQSPPASTTATQSTSGSTGTKYPPSTTVEPPSESQVQATATFENAPLGSQDITSGRVQNGTPPPVTSIEPVPATFVETPRRGKRTREPEQTATDSQARKVPKRNSTRSNATVQAQIEGAAVPGPSQTPRRPPVARMMATAQNDEDVASLLGTAINENETNEPNAESKKPVAKLKTRKAKARTRANENESTEAGENQQPAEKVKKPRKPRQQRAAHKSRSQSAQQENGENGGEAEDDVVNAEEEQESDPELHEIDPESLSMFNITRQKRYGKTSEREKKMAEIDWDEVKRKRRAEAEGELPTESQKNQQTGAAREDGEGGAASSKQEAAETRAVQGGLGFRIVDGEIVEDQDTLQIDRRAQAQAEIAMQAPVEEENDLTRFHNRATYLNDRKRDEKDRVPLWKSKSDPWNEDDTDRFYEALKNWGTDFQIISQLFQGKTRAQIKKKFNREEKIDPDRVTAALLGKDPVRMDLNAYAQAANLDVAAFNKFESLEHAQSIISESMRDKEEAMRVAVQEAEETERQRAVQEAQKKKGREAAESRKKLTQAKKAMRNKGMVWGAGTFGGGGGEEEEG